MIPLNLAEFFAETTGQLANFAEASTANPADVTNNDTLQADAAAPQTTTFPFVPLIRPDICEKVISGLYGTQGSGPWKLGQLPIHLRGHVAAVPARFRNGQVAGNVLAFSSFNFAWTG